MRYIVLTSHDDDTTTGTEKLDAFRKFNSYNSGCTSKGKVAQAGHIYRDPLAIANKMWVFRFSVWMAIAYHVHGKSQKVYF